MSILAIIAALLIEQWRPLGERKSVSATLSAWASSLERAFNGGERGRHAPALTQGTPLLDQQRGDDRADAHCDWLMPAFYAG